MIIPAKKLSILFAAAALFGAGWLNASLAQEAKVVARVNGAPITSGDIDLAREALAGRLNEVPADQQMPLLVNSLIESHLLAEAARAAGLKDTEEYKRRAAWAEMQVLRNVFVSEKLDKELTEADIRKRYDELVGNTAPQQEIKASHILVASADEARAIIVELNGGADFAELAKAKSTGPSGPNGGDLGFFGKGRMVPSFEAAAFALEKGQHSKEPVQSQFGWHVIKVFETREQAKPPYEAVKARVREVVLAERIEQTIKALREKAQVEITK